MNSYSGGNRGGSGVGRRMLLGSAASLLALAIAAPVRADSVTAGSSVEKGEEPPPHQVQDVLVTASPLFHDVRPERSLDEQGVASYGVSTVDELVAELQAEGADVEEPVFVVNGERVYDLDDIGAYPVEIIQQLQVLPRGTAPRVGGSPNQRVFSLTLHKRLRSATVTAAPRVATDGDWRSLRGETILTSVDGRRRGNIALRVRDEDKLLESDRGIIQPAARVPFATGGNVIAYPDLSGEIDPLLSDSAGEVVTVAPIPAKPNPTLGDFAAGANDPALDDLGRLRTLRPAFRNYDLNASYTAPLTPWLSSTTTLRLGRSTNISRIGPASGLFLLDDGNSVSPFSVPVALAIATGEPLMSRYRRTNGEGNLTLTAKVGGSWRVVFNGKHSRNSELTRTQGTDSFTAVRLSDSVNPFATDLASLVEIAANRARYRLHSTTAQVTATGSLLTLPAGDIGTTVEGRLGWQSIRSTSSFTDQDRKLDRSEQAVRGTLQVPLASRRNHFLPQLGELTANAELGHAHFSDAGDAQRSLFTLTWEPIEPLRLLGSIEHAREPAAVETLGAPTTVTPFVRIFDPVTGETVDATVVSGGNPGLAPQTNDTRRFSGIIRLVRSLGLQLSGEYVDSRNRNFVAALPTASQAVVLAFPERFVRNSDGVLTLVDLRPVNFANHRQQRLRWGLSLNAPLGGGAKPSFAVAGADSEESAEEAAAAAARKPPTRLQLTANHNIVLNDKIVIRRGLDPVDLLGGGAIGIAGARVRHQVDATGSITSGGTGLRVGATWNGPSLLNARIDGVEEQLRFSSLLTLNLRAFADARRLFPDSRLATGTRLSINFINLTNDRQRVRDSLGNTPLQYQPAYRDSLGRTIEFEIRKVF